MSKEDVSKEPLTNNEEEKAVLNNEKEADGNVPYEDNENEKVKFINGGATPAATEAQVDIEGKKEKEFGQAPADFVGLTKEELQRYASDPYWIKVRWGCLIAFWAAWIGMLVAAIIIIVVAPKCPPRPKLDWWQKSVVYQAYPRSFQDTDGNGVGDLKGVEVHLDHLKHFLNTSALWLNPVYPSMGADFGYDITDYKEIDPLFGSMEDFDNLRIAMHKRSMKLIMDFVPNHTSRNHTWFQQSRASSASAEENIYKDFYVWHPGKNGRAPNNWKSVSGGSAWTYDDQRGEYYLHQFLADQPDLNLRNEAVLTELQGVLKFWMEKGVDGFRVDAAAHLFEDAEFRDEPRSTDQGFNTKEYDTLSHIYTTYQPEGYELVTRWRELLDAYIEVDQKSRLMIVEVYGTPNETIPFYEYDGKLGAHMPTNMNLLKLKAGCNAVCIHEQVTSWMVHMGEEGRWANWQTGNHDNSRLSSRMSEQDVNAVNMLLLSLPGTATTYYGEEIGMHDVDSAGSTSRDPFRTPMQWSDAENAGFTTAEKPWLPVADDYFHRNVKAQLATGSGVSNIEVYAQLSALREEPSMQWGTLKDVIVTPHILSYVRQAKGFPGYLVAINFGTQAATTDYHSALPDVVAREGTVVTHTANFGPGGEDFEIGNTVPLDGVHIKPKEGIIFMWPADAVEQ